MDDGGCTVALSRGFDSAAQPVTAARVWAEANGAWCCRYSVAGPNRGFEQELCRGLLSTQNPDVRASEWSYSPELLVLQLDAELIEQLRLIEQTIAEPSATQSPQELDQRELDQV